jgi:hypothetical protein
MKPAKRDGRTDYRARTRKTGFTEPCIPETAFSLLRSLASSLRISHEEVKPRPAQGDAQVLVLRPLNGPTCWVQPNQANRTSAAAALHGMTQTLLPKGTARKALS